MKNPTKHKIENPMANLKKSILEDNLKMILRVINPTINAAINPGNIDKLKLGFFIIK